MVVVVVVSVFYNKCKEFTIFTMTIMHLVYPKKLSHNRCFQFLLGVTVSIQSSPREMEGYFYSYVLSSCLQLFRERLSEKVHATMLKGIVGSTEVTVLQQNLKEWHERLCTYVLEY